MLRLANSLRIGSGVRQGARFNPVPITWENPILTSNGTTWERDLVYTPRILKNIDGTPYVDGDGKYWMYYAGGKTQTVGSEDTMGLAKSSDLVTWARAGQVMGLGTTYDKADLVFVTVVKDGATFRAWYEGNRDAPPSSDYVTINYATSLDGLSWTRHVNNPILVQGTTDDSLDLYAPVVIKDGSVWKMWYTGHNASGQYNLMYATATNPEGPWTKGRLTYIFTNANNYVSFSEVWINDGIYWATYYGGSSSIELAYSINGLNWVKYKDLYTPPAAQWDSGVAYWPSQILVNNKWYTYYSGHNGDWESAAIGLFDNDNRIGEAYPTITIPTTFTDTFTGTDNKEVAVPWIRSTVGVQVNMIYLGNKGTFVINNTGSTKYLYYQPINNNQYAQINGIAATANSFVSAIVRSANAFSTGYELILERWNGVYTWYLYDGSTLITQGSATGINALRIEANGTTITAKKSTDNGVNWTVLHSFSSGTYASGYSGIRGQSGNAYIYFDNYECGNL